MQKILTALVLVATTAGAWARTASLLVYQVWEEGGDPYVSRIIVTPDFLRLDEGGDADGYTLFDRRRESLYNVSTDERSVLVMERAGPVPEPNDALILREAVAEDPQAPRVAGRRPKNVRLLANGELCSELVVVEGVMQDALDGLREMRSALARIHAATLEAVPLDQRTPCDLASNVYAPDRSVRFGLPLQERSAGRSQSLVDFSDDYAVGDSMFEIPGSFDRRPLFAPVR